MNKPDTKLHECIYVAEKIIPADICDVIVKDIESREWTPHRWYNLHKECCFYNKRDTFLTKEINFHNIF